MNFRKELIALLNFHSYDNKTNMPDALLADHLIDILDDMIEIESYNKLPEDFSGMDKPTFEGRDVKWHRCVHDESDFMYTAVLRQTWPDENGDTEEEEIQFWWSPYDYLWVNWGDGNDSMDEDMIIPEAYVQNIFLQVYGREYEYHH